MRPFEFGRNITLDGDDFVLSSNASVTLALAFHELATNAAKYGGLSISTGRVRVEWRVTGGNDDARLQIEWSEAGGPPVVTPKRRGFGSKLIEVSLVRGLDATVDRVFDPAGLRCSIAIPITAEVRRAT